MRGDAPVDPADGPVRGLLEAFVVRRHRRHHVIQRHDDVGAYVVLDVHRFLGRQEHLLPVHRALEPVSYTHLTLPTIYSV